MNICVTGGAGFIGSHLCDVYLEAGHTVTAVDNLSTGNAENVPDGVRFVEMDVTTEQFQAFCESERFDAYNHHAAHMELRASVNRPVYDATNNIVGSIRVLEAAKRTQAKHIVLASSIAVFGVDVPKPLTEEFAMAPSSPYGVSKASQELYARYYQSMFGLPIVTLRYTNVYGPRQNPFGESGVVAIFLQKFLTGKTPTVHGDGSQARDYVYIRDVMRANLLATEANLRGTYIVSTGLLTTVSEVIDGIRLQLHQPCPVRYDDERLGDPKFVSAWHTLFTQACGWEPRVQFEEGLAETVRWFRSHVKV
jgi:UDP-glucose 4-epimerase